MSYASIASHNIPEGEMPKPDQNLREGGHFEGETEINPAVDSKVNVLPAGSDPEHPVIEEAASEPITVDLHPASEPEPSVSESAPEPLPTLPKGSIKIPQSGAEFEAKAKEVEKKAEKKADQVEKKAEKVEKKAEKELKSAEKEIKSAGKKVQKEFNAAEKKVEETAKEYGKKAQEEINKAESALGPYWEKTKDVVLRPGTLGGLMGVVNVGILGTLGYFAYTRKDQPWDRRIVGGAVAGTLALFGAEGYVTESYLETPEGRQEAERAKAEGSRAYLQAKEVILRPQVAGGLVGALNVAILGAVGYFSYQNWNRSWDPRTVTAVSVGLIGLSGLEGYAGKAYKDNELPKH